MKSCRRDSGQLWFLGVSGFWGLFVLWQEALPLECGQFYAAASRLEGWLAGRNEILSKSGSCFEALDIPGIGYLNVRDNPGPRHVLNFREAGRFKAYFVKFMDGTIPGRRIKG